MSLRIALIMPARTASVGGVQRFAASLLPALVASGNQVVPYWFHPDAGTPRTLKNWAKAVSMAFARLYSTHFADPFDAVVSTFHHPAKVLPGVPMLGFVHDLRLWGLHREDAPARARWRRDALVLRAELATWDAALVPSDHVAGDVRRLRPELRIVNVSEGLDHLAPHGGAAAPRDALLVIAGHAPHKRGGLGQLVAERMSAELGCHAVIIGQLPRPCQKDGIEHHANPDDELLARLYSRARVVVAPTSYEGFGLAAGEAMWFGAPVVFAHDGMLAGLVGDGGVGAESTVDGFCQAVRVAWEDSARLGACAQGIARRQTWLRTADLITDEVRHQADRRRSAVADHPPVR